MNPFLESRREKRIFLQFINGVKVNVFGMNKLHLKLLSSVTYVLDWVKLVNYSN